MGLQFLLNGTTTAFAELFISFGIALIFVIILALYYFIRSKKKKFCDNLVSTKRQLFIWRVAFYGLLLIPVSIIFFSCVYPFFIKYLLHLIFLFLIWKTFKFSFPSWICKSLYKDYKCNCDRYEYYDFYPGLALSFVFSTVLFFLSEIFLLAFALFSFYIIILVALYFLIPKKKMDDLVFSSESMLTSLEDLQIFLTTHMNKKKLITFVHPGCEFCTLQLSEINQLTYPNTKFVRILDPSKVDFSNNFFFEFLNIDINTLSYPTTLIIQNGISADIKEGVLSLLELKSLFSATSNI